MSSLAWKTKELVFRKVVNPGRVYNWSGKRRINVFCEIEYTVDGRLSITGVVGPRPSGNAEGGCGQIQDTLSEITVCTGYGVGWDKKKVERFQDIWNRWHLNDMRSECVHQRELGWTYENHHGVWEVEFVENNVIDEYDTGVVEERWRFNQYKGEPCPVCGYNIGSAWLKEAVPPEVIEFLMNLPNTTITPAWV